MVIGKHLYIIKEREVGRSREKGGHFGEKALQLECPRTIDVIAKANYIIYLTSIETL
jgi:hypothetical protein